MSGQKRLSGSSSATATANGSESSTGIRPVNEDFFLKSNVETSGECDLKFRINVFEKNVNLNLDGLEDKLLEVTNNVAKDTIDRGVKQLARSLTAESLKYADEQENTNKKINTILICLDELIAFHNLPESFTRILPGYNNFKKIGVEFTNIHNNRQFCTAARATMQTSILNTGLQDNIDQIYQYNYIPELNPDFNTIAKVFKKNDIQNTAYYGKAHLDIKVVPNIYIIPRFNTNARYTQKKYGFDISNTFGDTFYDLNHGFYSDQTTQEFKINNLNEDFDYANIDGEKFIGILPFLQARNEDNQSFHLQCHFQNPHDTMQFYQNYSQKPVFDQMQFFSPFLHEQTTAKDIADPYFFDKTFPDAYIKNSNMIKNYFEHTFDEYSNNNSSLPFLNSYMNDYATSPVTNSPFAFYAGLASSFKPAFSFPNDITDYASWKNLVNNYYCLIYEVDNYINQIYEFLKKYDMLKNTAVIITSDHGDQMSSHGLKQKGLPFKESTNIPFLVYSPQLKPGTSNILGCALDLAPTLETLANLNTHSNDFKGKSLLNLSNNILSVREENVPVFNIFNAFMTYQTYFTYKTWYFQQTPEVQNLSQYSYADNFFEYLGHYSMYVDYIDGVQYKLVRFYSIREVVAYNLVFNDTYDNIFTPESIISYITDSDSKFIEFIIGSGNNILIQFKEMLANSGFKSFTFEEMYNYITSITPSSNGNTDSEFLILFMICIINYIQFNNNYSLLIPGVEIQTDKILLDPHYYFFLYNMNEDTDEIINLLDKNFPERQSPTTIDIAKQMNDRLNNIIPSFCDEKGLFVYLLPTQILLNNLKLIVTYGSTYQNYSAEQIINAITSFLTNSLDSGVSLKDLRGSILNK